MRDGPRRPRAAANASTSATESASFLPHGDESGSVTRRPAAVLQSTRAADSARACRRWSLAPVASRRSRRRAASRGDAPRFVEEVGAIDHRYAGDFQFFVGGGVAAFDCDDDGRSELFFAGGSEPAALYHNDSERGRRAPVHARAVGRHRPDRRHRRLPARHRQRRARPTSPCCASARTSCCAGSATAGSSAPTSRFGVDGGDTWTVAFSATWEDGNELPTLAFGDYLERRPRGLRGQPAVRPDPDAGTYVAAGRARRPATARCRCCSATGAGPAERDLRMTNDRHYYRDGDGPAVAGRPRRDAAAVHRGRRVATAADLGDGHRQRRPHRRRLSRGVPDEPGRQQAADARRRAGAAGVRGHRPRPAAPPRIARSPAATSCRPRPGTPSSPTSTTTASSTCSSPRATSRRRTEFAMRDPSNLLIGQADGTFVEGAEDGGHRQLPPRRAAPRSSTSTSTGCSTSSWSTASNRSRCGATSARATADAPEPMGDWIGRAAARSRRRTSTPSAPGSRCACGDGTTSREVTVGGGHAGGQLGWLHFGLGDAERGRGPGAVARRRDRPVDDGAGERVCDHRAGCDRGDPVGSGGGVMTTTTQRGRAVLADVELPDFGMPAAEPLLPPSIYAERIERLRERMEERGYDHARRVGRPRAQRQPRLPHRIRSAVRGGGAHRRRRRAIRRSSSATSATEPPRRRRFRCAASASRTSACRRSRATRRCRFPRSSPPKASPPAAASASSDGRRTPAATTIEVPSFLVDELRRVTGPTGLVENATDLFIDAADGLRVVNEVEQLAAFEWAACQTSHGVRNLAHRAAPGNDRARGGPAARVERHAAVLPPDADRRAAGEVRAAEPRRPADRARRPADDGVRHLGRAQLPGGVRRRGRVGAARRDRRLCRTARRARTSRRWPSGTRRCTSARREASCRRSSTATSATRSSASPSTRATSSHLDEWVNSPVFAGSTIELRSGMALQCDIIPATGTPYFTTNIEDGLALADESLRAAFASGYPDAWARIEARRRVHDRGARDRPAPRRAAVLEPRRPPATVPAPARPGDAHGHLTAWRARPVATSGRACGEHRQRGFGGADADVAVGDVGDRRHVRRDQQTLADRRRRSAGRRLGVPHVGGVAAEPAGDQRVDAARRDRRRRRGDVLTSSAPAGSRPSRRGVEQVAGVGVRATHTWTTSAVATRSSSSRRATSVVSASRAPVRRRPCRGPGRARPRAGRWRRARRRRAACRAARSRCSRRAPTTARPSPRRRARRRAGPGRASASRRARRPQRWWRPAR